MASRGPGRQAKKRQSQTSSGKILLLLLCLRSCDLGPEILPLGDRGRVASTPPVKAAIFPKVAGSSRLPLYQGKDPPVFDQNAFLISFRRQGGKALLQCLEQWRAGPAQLLLRGILDANGKLHEIGAIQPGLTPPGCLNEQLEQMDFAQLLKKDEKNDVNDGEKTSLHLQWNVEW